MSKRPRAGSAWTTKNQPATKRGPGAQKAAFAPLANQPVTKRRVLAAEKKNVDVNGTIQNTGGTALGLGTGVWTVPGAPTLLNGLAPGNLATNRIGRKVGLTKFTMNYTFSMAATSTGGGQARIHVVYDKQSNAAAPAVLDRFAYNDLDAVNNLSNEDRFITIADEMTEPISLQNNFSVSGKINRKIDLETIFNTGTSGLIADITSGAVYLLVSQNGQIGTAAPLFGYFTRMRFLDY